ncbi:MULTISPECIES: hypothetical protein [unclassified Cryobacterium]|uniref:hypothetical protein n=1 Tax=unclassified Cryobacterium TaxID=2649013 RepID=UPI00141B3060|nr:MULTISPECIES: hypothetical protein [unclassified Cryobacterium]
MLQTVKNAPTASAETPNSSATMSSRQPHIYPKLGVSSRTAAVAAGRQAGLIRRA